MLPISAVMITFNESQVIRPTLEALSFCDEIIVLDSGSTDGTLEICREMGAKVFEEPFRGFGKQKQCATSMAKHHWILSIDADEVVSEELSNNIQRLMKKQPTHAAYGIRRTLVFLGKEFKHGKESREVQVRLFDRRQASFNDAEVHEKVEYKGKAPVLEGVLRHYSYRNLGQYLDKLDKYTHKAATEMFAKGKSRSTFLLVLSFPFYLFKNLVIQGNWLNGYPGWLWALLSSIYPVVKYSRLMEMHKTSDDPSKKTA